MESMDGPQKKLEKEPKSVDHVEKRVSDEPLAITKNVYQRFDTVGRRGAMGLLGATAASAIVGKVGADITTPLVMPHDSHGQEVQREQLKRQLKEFEDARAKGTKEGFDKWIDSLRQGFGKHGLDTKAISEFSETALKLRLQRLDWLAEGYSVAHGLFFVVYAGITFTPVKSGIESYLKNKSLREKDRKTEAYANDLGARVSAIEADIHSFKEREQVSPDEFRELIERMKLLEQQAAPLLSQNRGSAPEDATDQTPREA